MSDPTEAPTIVFIHGAGPQDGEQGLKETFDRALAPGVAVKSDVPRYAQVFWEQSLGGSAGASLEGQLDAIATGGQPPAAAASAVLAAVAGRRLPGMRPPGESADALALVTSWFELADLLEAEAHDCAPDLLPEWAFRKLAAKAGADVSAYLYDDEWRPLMQYPVIERLGGLADPLVVIAHSLGSILGYDVLCRSDFAGRDIRLLVTAGSPLGISNVRDKLNEGKGPGTLPTKIQRWGNFTDWHDLVPALGQQLAPFYQAPPPLKDHIVDNRARNNHDLDGYLQVEALRALVRPFRGPA